MKTQLRWAGYSLVEVLSAMLAASVLALTAGAIIAYFAASWQRNFRLVETQREAEAAVKLMGEKLREAAAGTVSAASARLDVQSAAFYASGSDLLYDPDTGAAGDEVTLIGGRLSAFNPVVLSTGVSIEIAAQSSGESLLLQSVFAFRN